MSGFRSNNCKWVWCLNFFGLLRSISFQSNSERGWWVKDVFQWRLPFLSRKCWLAHSRKSVFIKNMLVRALSQLSPYRVAARRRILRRLENMQRHSLEGGWMDYQNECLSVDTFCCLWINCFEISHIYMAYLEQTYICIEMGNGIL